MHPLPLMIQSGRKAATTTVIKVTALITATKWKRSEGFWRIRQWECKLSALACARMKMQPHYTWGREDLGAITWVVITPLQSSLKGLKPLDKWNHSHGFTVGENKGTKWLNSPQGPTFLNYWHPTLAIKPLCLPWQRIKGHQYRHFPYARIHLTATQPRIGGGKKNCVL